MKMSGLSSGTRLLYEIWNRLSLLSLSSCLRGIWQIPRQQLYRVSGTALQQAYRLCVRTTRAGGLQYRAHKPRREDSLCYSVPSLPPLADTPVIVCPKFPTLQNINRPQSIPLNSPRTATGNGEVVRFHAYWLSCAQPLC